jgi:hypothetical protein
MADSDADDGVNPDTPPDPPKDAERTEPAAEASTESAGEAGTEPAGEASTEEPEPASATPEQAEPSEPEPGGAESEAERPESMSAEPAEPAPEESIPARPVRRRRRVLRWVAASLAIVVLAAGGTVFYLYERLQGNIHKENVEPQLGPDRPPKLNKSMNILLLGSDSRDGENKAYWSPDISGERSDTTILLHLSPNRDRAVAVSFPRDSMVRVPQCTKKNGQKVAPFFGMINAAFAYAGASCTWKTIESTTDIHIDHYVKIDFTGFKRVVDALGGVEI